MIDTFAIIGVALVIMLLLVLFLLPSSSGVRTGRKKARHAESDNKDWKVACLKLEKHIHSLRGQIEQDQAREKKMERDILIQREKYKKLQEKISQERGWQEKESADKGRKNLELIELKKSLSHAENELQKEHGDRLRLEREIKEAKEAAAAAAETKRVLESQIARVAAQLESAQKDLGQVREQNAKLSRQHDEATWVAKSEYVKLEQQLRHVEKEFALFRSQIRREAT